MALEIERKFFVTGNEWRTEDGVRMVQGYLSRHKERTVRVRTVGKKAFLTVKGLSKGAVRAEFEYEIPIEDAEAMLVMCDGPLVVKMRHTVEYAGMKWEVDEFLGQNAGLVVAEIELESEDQEFEKPSWVLQEVTDDPRFYNSNLSTREFRSWYDTVNTN